MKSQETKKIVLAAVFVAIGILLPFLTGQVPQIGNMLLPMHLPVFLAGLILGWKYGLLVGVITPLLRSFIFSMPPLVPTALAMAFELATYGFLTGFIYDRLPKKQSSIYCALIPSMIIGRLIWGLASAIIYSAKGMQFTWGIFIAAGFVNAIPGIILQIVLIPLIMFALKKAKLIPSFVDKNCEELSSNNDNDNIKEK